MAENKKPMSFDEWANAGGGAVTPVKTGLAGRVGDLGLSAIKGTMAVPEFVVGVADMATGGKAGKKAEELGFRPKEAKAFLDSQMSDAAKDAEWRYQNADGFMGKVAAGIENPSLISNAIAESLSPMGAGAVVGRGLMKVGSSAVKAAAGGVSPALPGVMARTFGEAAPAVAAAAGEGIVGAGSAAEGIRQETANGELTGTQSLLAAGSGAATGLLGFGGAKAAKALGVGDIDQAIVGGTTKVAGQAGKEAPGMLSSMGRGALSEGVFEELPQSLSEQAIQNVALDRPWTQDLDAAAAMGLLTGGAMGGGMGLIGRQDTPAAAPPPATTPAPVPPAGPAQTTTPPAGATPPPVITPAAPATTGEAQTAGPLRTTYVDASKDSVAGGKAGDVIRVGDQFQYAPEGSQELSDWKSMISGRVSAQPAPPKPSEQMGLNPAAGPLSAAAVTAVDGDATPSMQAAAQAAAQQDQATQAQQQSDSKLKSSGWTMNEFPVGDEPMVASLESKDAPLFMTQTTAEDGTPTFNVRDTDWNVIATGSTFEEAAGRAKVQQASGGKAQVTPQTTGATDGVKAQETIPQEQGRQAEQDGDWSMGAKPIATPPSSGFQDSTAKRAQGLKAIRERNGLNKPVALIDEGKTAPRNRDEYVAEVRRQIGDIKDGDTLTNDVGDVWTVDAIVRDKNGDITLIVPKERGDGAEGASLDIDGIGSILMPSPYTDANGERKMSGPGTVTRRATAQTDTAEQPGTTGEGAGASQPTPLTIDARKRNLATLKARMMAGRKAGTVTDEGIKRAEPSLDDMLKAVNDELANHDSVKNAATRAKRDQIRKAIAERDFPDVLKAVDGDVDTAEAINQAFQFAGDEPRAKVVERVLKNRGITDEYRKRWGERLAPTESATDKPQAESDVGQQWNRSTTVEREGLAVRAGLSPVAAKNLAKRGWDAIDRVAQENIERGLKKKAAVASTSAYFEAGTKDKQAGKLRTLPKEFANVTGKEEKDWYAGWDAAEAPATTPAPAPADDLDAMFDDVLAEEVAKDEAASQPDPKPTNLKQAITQQRAKRAPRTATQAATSAAKNTASALGNAIDGLGALFGGKGKLNSGLSFDAETYAKAKPLFQAAVANLGEAGRDMKEAMRAVVRMVMDKFGAQVAQNMKPYVVKFIQETNQENLDTTTSQADTGTKENNDERTQVRGNGPQALGGMAAQENGGTEGQRGTAERVPGSGTDGNEQGSGTGGAGDAADAGRSGSNPGGRAGTTRATGRGRLGGKGAGGDGGRVSGASTSGEENRPEVRGGVPEGGTGSEAPASIPAVNFRITPDLRLGQGGEVQKFKDNVAAIEVLKRIEAENRRATAAEQFILARYVGWGGLANAFPDPMSGEFKEKWKERGEALRELLTDTEYANARRSTQDAHYTSETVVSAMWGMARKLGFKGGLTLENSLGSGNFVGLVPEGLAAKFIGVEQDSLTARIAQALYPQATVLNSGLQDVPLSDNAFALNIGNPPFGSKPLRFQFKPELAGKSIHNQFFLSGLDALRPGGLQVMVVSRYLMDAQDKSSRLAMAKKAKLVGLFRLPDNAFRENARTDVVTDIVVFQKLTEAEQADMGFAVAAYSQGKQKGADAEAERAALAAKVPYWVETTQVADPLGGEPMTVNAYFKQNPGDVLGVLERSGSMQHGNDITVRLDDVAQLPGLLERATSRLPANIQSLSDEVMAATEARFKSMSDALRIALAKEEEGHLKIDADGKMQRVIERGTPEGDYELARQEITPDSPWSDQLRQDANGKWYRMEVVTGEDGKPVKQVNADGKATKFNVYKQVVFADDADIPESLRLGKTGFDRLVGIIKLRDLLKRQLELETADAPKLAMEGNRKKLAAAYDEFVAKHGPVNRSTNSRLADTMPDGGLVQALEVSYQPERSKEQAKRSGLEVQPEVAKPAPILKERVVPKYEPATKAASPADALAITLAETGRVDIDRIAQLLGVDGNEAADMLQSGDAPLAFNDPETSTWETANNYLSGMVKRKLNAAKQAGLEKNVTALEKVQPEAWTAENVTVQMGSTWVPPEVYADFIKHLTGGQARVRFSAVTNSFSVDAQGGAKAKDWSTGRASVGEIVTRMLNSQAVVVRDTDSDGSSRINQEETSLAGLKAREINSEFLDWVFQDSDRRSRLVEIFNDKFNTRVNRQYDGSHLMLPGKVPDTIIAMRRHQLNAIWRGIYERFMLVDHAVGAGKTYTAIARAMERRRMGLSQKPMIVVPNHLVEQWAADVYRLYPGAKVLAAGKKDFEAKRRRRVFGKVATGDWDIVIVPHSSFGFIGIAPETEARYLEQEMELAKQAIADAWEQAKEDGTDQGYRKPFGVKEAERLTDKIQARMDKLNSGAKDRLLTFEQLGVDDLTIDESHEFKNLYYSSRLTGVRGMGNKTGSKKANDLYNKVRVMRDSPTGSVAFLTGTPISNSAVEMFTVMRYLAADSLRESGMEHFDSWRAQYVEATPAFEPTESGRLKEVTRLGRTWSNMRSLMDLYYQFTDAVSLDDIKKWFAEDNKGKQFPVPKVKGGKDRRLVPVPPTAAQDAELKAVMSDFDGLDDIEDTYERNATRLRLMDRARKLSLDIRAVNPRANSKEEGGKLEVVSKEVKRIYDQWSDDKGTQLIFLDRSVPKSKGDDAILKEYDALVAKRDAALRANDEEGIQDALDSLEKFDSNEMAELRIAQAGGWNAYQQIKDNLVAMGIPAAEIRFIQEATNDEQKMAMFDAVNGGKVRVMIGSTPRMGAGTNVQQRVVALHHVDVTWKPSDIEQREGRAIRQGNKLLDKYGPDFEVEIMAYATERTVDAKMWDLNATKLRTINGIRNYDGAFSMEFEDEEAVGMAEMAALASGNPMLLERVKLESELNNLELLQKAHSRKMFGIRDARDAAKKAIERNPELIAQARAVSDFITKRLDAVEARHAKRSVAVDGKEYFTQADALIAAENEIARQQEGNEKARYSINVNGKRVTSRSDLENEISAALGDYEAFEAKIGNKTLKERTVAAREVAALVNPELVALPSDGAKNLEVGEMLGYKLAAELTRYIDRGNGMAEVSLTLFDADGKTVASETANRQPAMATFTTSMLRPSVEKLWAGVKRKASTANADYLEKQMQRAIQELPDLEERASAGFPKAQEIAEKRARLANVVSALSGNGQQTDDEAPAASRARPVFSRAAQGQASGVVQGIVDAITARWANAPKVVVAFDMSDPAIPERVRQEDQRQRSGGAEGTPEGFYYKGTVYLMSSKLANPRDVVRVLFHESLGHFGLRGVFGKELKPLLQQIATMRKSQVEAKMKEYGLRGVSNVDRLVAAEEVLAEMAQSSPQIGFVRRAVATIKAWLRKNIPGFMGMNMSDDEIITSFIMPARNYVVNGGPDGGTGGGVRFNRSVGDASPDEAQKVQAAIEGKSLIDAAKFVVDTGEARHRVVAEMVTEKLKALQSAGVSLDLKIAHRGFPVPTALFNSRGYTESAFDDKGRDITVWLNGADVTGKVGTDYETLLHELVHAATMGGVLHGSTVRGSPFAKDAADLMEVTDAIASHINKRFDDADAGRVSLTEFELDMRAGANNAFTKDDETLAWALSSVEAQQYLETIPYKKSGQTMWGRFVQAVRSAIGLEAKADTALSEVLRLGASIMSTDGDANVRGVRAFWHKRGLKMATQQANGSVVLRNEVGPAYPDSPTHQKKMDQAETPTNPDIRFSRTMGEAMNAGVNNVRDMKLPAGYMVNDLIQSHGKLGWWSKTVGTQFHLAQKSPAFKRVFDSAQGFLNDVSYYASEAANAAPTLLPKLETLKDLGKQAISAADNKAIAAPIFEGTLVWGRRDDGSLYRIDQSDEDTAPGVVFSDAELREQFNLTDDQISLYREFRAATDKSLTNMGLADMVRFGGKDLEAVADEVLSAENFGQALAIAGTQLRAVAQAEPKRAAVLLDTIAKMVEKVNKYQGLMDKGYAPLSRFGRHTLDVVDENGDRVYFGLFESESEANKMARQMRANYPGAQVAQGTVSEEEHKLFAGVSPETVELFGEMLGLEGTGDEAADMAFQQYLKMAKANRSAMKRLIHRKGIAGFSEDPGRVLAGFVYSNARQTSSAVNMGELTQAVAAIPKGQGELKDHAVRLHNYVKNPIEEAQAFRGLLFAQYIGGSVASAIINTTQPFAVTMPWLSQFGGVSKAAKQMSAAVKDALKGSTGDAVLDKALLKAAEDGIVSPQEVFQLQAQAAGRATLKAGDGTKAGDAMATGSNALSKLGIAWGQLFGLAEQFNRRTTFIAAYRTAVDQGMNNPAAFAERAISETQFIYSKATSHGGHAVPLARPCSRSSSTASAMSS
jgi:N12 class adenine-specific DNA methylase